MVEEGIQEILEKYSRGLSGTEKDIPSYRQLYTSLIQTLPKARDGKEFVVGLLCATVLHDLLRNSVENRYLKNSELKTYLQKLSHSVTEWATLDWKKIGSSLFELGDKYRRIPAAQRSGYYVEVGGFKYYVSSTDDNLLGVEGIPLLAFFDLDANLSDPKIAPEVAKWYAKVVKDLLEDLDRKGKKVHGLLFIEKSFSDIGAVTLMPYLVSETQLPASVYRMDYWNQDAKVVGQNLLPESNYCIIYDLIGHGNAVLEAHEYLTRHYGSAVKGCVAFFDYDIGGGQALLEKDIRLVSRVKLDEVRAELEAKTLSAKKLMKIATRVPTPKTEEFAEEAKKILSQSIL